MLDFINNDILFNFLLMIIIIIIILNRKEFFTSQLDISKLSAEELQQLQELSKKAPEHTIANHHKTDLEGILNLSSLVKNKHFHIKNLEVEKAVEIDGDLNSKNSNIGKKLTTTRLDVKNGNGHHTHFNYNNESKNYIRGNTTNDHGNLTAENMYIGDMLNTRRLDIRNDKGKGTTHFNYAHQGQNYIRGDVHKNHGQYVIDNLSMNNIVSDTAEVHRIEPYYHCEYHHDYNRNADTCITNAINDAGNRYGDLIPMKWSSHGWLDKTGFVTQHWHVHNNIRYVHYDTQHEHNRHFHRHKQHNGHNQHR
jgi:hypothetical protein